jgi:hypothetical protein
MDKIYLLTTVHIGNEPTHKDKSLIKRKRTVGWFPTLEDVVWVIVCNEGDIHEAGHYDHCVIEEMYSGLYPTIGRGAGKERWFKWAKDEYFPADRPAGLEDSCNFGNIG